jgi:archaellum component FlaC
MADSPSSPSPRAASVHALCVYAEPLAARRRVVVVGDASLGLDERLVELGARTVHVYDPDADRARAHAASAGSRAVTVRALPAGEFDVRDGAFDLAIVPDLGLIEDRAALLSRLRRLVGNDGASLVCAYNGEERAASAGSKALDYYELYDLVSLQFANVRMVGQVPFAGVALAELGESDEEPQVSVDTQLVTDAEAPELFIALAGQRDVRLDAYAIVQIPRVPTAASSASGPRPDSPEQQAALAEAVLRADLLSAQLEEQRGLATRMSADVERGKRVDDLEQTLKERLSKLKEAETRAGDHYVRAERLTHDLRKQEEELQRQRDRATRLAKELEDEKRLRTRAEVDLGMVRKAPELQASRERTALLEEALRSAEEATIVLQARVVEAEQAVHARDRQLALLASELDAYRGALETSRVDAGAIEVLAARAAQAEARLAQMELRAARADQAEARASQMERHAVRADEAEAALRELLVRAQSAEARSTAFEREASRVSEADVRLALADQQLQQLASRAERAEARLASFDVQLTGVADAHAEELSELEMLLHQRAHAIAALEHELLRRESIVRELIAALEEAREQAETAPAAEPLASDAVIAPVPPLSSTRRQDAALTLEAMREIQDHLATALTENAELRTRLDSLALEVARREGELHTRSWRVAELEEEVAVLASVAPPPPDASSARAEAPPVAAVISSDVAALRGELDVLRQALAQEHEVRQRLESGEELTRARSELARQATLLEQLALELDARDRARAPGQVHDEAQR